MITGMFSSPPPVPPKKEEPVTLEFCLWLHHNFDALLEVLHDELR